MSEVNKKIEKILKKVFKKSKIPKKIDNLKLGDLKEWDSLGNFNLILEIENEFSKKFNANDFSKINSIKTIKELLK